MSDALIIDATRTPWGKFGGALKEHRASDLAALLIRRLVERNGVDPAAIDNVILGQVLQAGAGQLPSRQALMAGGLPPATPSTLINKVCGSGMRAVTLAAGLIRSGEARMMLAGGMESMSNVPYYDTYTRWGARMGNKTLVDGMVFDGLWCAFDDVHMANQADDMAAQREHFDKGLPYADTFRVERCDEVAGDLTQADDPPSQLRPADRLDRVRPESLGHGGQPRGETAAPETRIRLRIRARENPDGRSEHSLQDRDRGAWRNIRRHRAPRTAPGRRNMAGHGDVLGDRRRVAGCAFATREATRGVRRASRAVSNATIARQRAL